MSRENVEIVRRLKFWGMPPGSPLCDTLLTKRASDQPPPAGPETSGHALGGS
jgi:hypothetical protein